MRCDVLFALAEQLVFSYLPAATLYGVAAAFLPLFRARNFLHPSENPVSIDVRTRAESAMFACMQEDWTALCTALLWGYRWTCAEWRLSPYLQLLLTLGTHHRLLDTPCCLARSKASTTGDLLLWH